MTSLSNTELQQRAINKLSRLKVGALFMEMGTGKTKVALDLAQSKIKKCDYFLYLCPCSVKTEILNEKEKWQPNLPLDIVGVESIGMSDRIYMETLEKLSNAQRAFIILDESLKIKNQHAKTTQRIMTFRDHSEYRIILNGTPLSKNCLDLYTQFRFLSPKIIPESYTAFRKSYCEFYTKGEMRGRVRRQHNIPHLISRVSPYIFDAKLELEISAFYREYSYDMTLNEEEAYEDLKERMINELDMTRDIGFFALTSKLQNFYSCCQSKREALRGLISIVDDKVLVFCKFVGAIPEGALHITGEMNTTQRAATIERFKKPEEKVMYITYGCGAFGLNLQFCRNIIFADGTFNYAERVQAEARIYRLGQEKDVVYYELKNSSVGLEKLIYRSLDKKEDMLSEMKREISNLDEKRKREWLKKHL